MGLESARLSVGLLMRPLLLDCSRGGGAAAAVLLCSPVPACLPCAPCFSGVGEESGAELTHAVVELLFTTSIE